jgi:alkaline phosphatase isozyme conversion protein
MRARKMLAVLLAVALSVTLVAPAAASADTDYGTKAYSYMEQLSAMPRFVADPAQELAAAEKVQEWFGDEGYRAGLQGFSFKYRSATYHSQNVVAFKPAAGRRTSRTPLVIVGAHYDAVPVGKGTDDNASGVGVLLEVAGRIKDAELPYDLMFISFGAEEAGLFGSDYFVKTMSTSSVKRTIVMVNYDSLAVGDRCYIHAGFNKKTWARDEMLEIIDRLGLPIETQPGLNKKYPAGLTPNGFSDYTAFNKKRIPIVAFEATNWSIGEYDGWIQTEQYGSFWHTANDDLAIIESLFPGRPLAHLHAYTELTYEFLASLRP